MKKEQKIAIAVIVVVIVVAGFYLIGKNRSTRVKQIDISSVEEKITPRNTGPVSPISGLECENWNRRAIAVSQPGEPKARPAAGFSEADMVIEMPTMTAGQTRLLGVYLCNIPEDIGAIRSARHDFIHIADGLDAIFAHWGGSIFAYNKLNKKVMDSVDCMAANSLCGRWPEDGKRAVEDRSHVTGENLLKMVENKGFRKEGNFSGYSHQPEVSLEQRPEGGHLRVAFAKPYDVEYDYDKQTNSYLRTWGGVADKDKNNGQRIAPKNIAVIFAYSEQITNSQDYVGKGLENPWADVPVEKNTGSQSISGRYNNVQVGDPWYDESDSGPAKYYMNGQEYNGNWKKDKSKLNSKLFFYDEKGGEINFVPGQIWVEILEPGQALRWEPVS